MSTFKPDTHRKLKEEFIKQTKLVLKEQISKNPDKLQEYKVKIIEAFNNYIQYIFTFYNLFDSVNKKEINSEIVTQREKLSRCFGALGIKNSLPQNLLCGIDINKIEFEFVDETLGATFSGATSSAVDDDSKQDNSKISESLEKSQQTKESLNLPSEPQKVLEPNDIFPNFEQIQVEDNAMDQQAFLAFAAKQIHNNYSGDPLELTAFINSVKLLKQIGPTHLEILKTFLLTKLTGKALESVSQDAANVDEIIASLQANIKPDSSKVIEGKMMALKLDNSKTVEFTSEAEKLAEALQRSFIVEGISQVKAKSMAVDKTVEMCRQTAKSNLVRSVLASSSFATPQEVVAKFVVESANDAKEKQIFKFSQQQNRLRGNNRNNSFGGRTFFQNRNNNNRNFNSSNNWRNYNSNWRNNPNRGRGRGRNFNNYRGQNDRFAIRLANAENAVVPPGDRRATTNENQIMTFQRINDN